MKKVIFSLKMEKENNMCDKHSFLVDKNVHPQTLAVLETRAKPIGITVKTFDPNMINEIEAEFFGIFWNIF